VVPQKRYQCTFDQDEYIAANPAFRLFAGIVFASKGDEITMENTIWKLTLAYDGTEFHGWQIQASRSQTPTIQATLGDAIATVTGERVLPQGSGRTDAGVHAAAQVVSFSLTASIPPANLHRALNRALPDSIRVLAAEHAPPGFHARHSAVGKLYQYRIFHGPVCSPFLARYVARSRWPLDFGAMQHAAQTILGEHDFTSFAACDPDRATRLEQRETQPIYTNIRRIDASEWSCSPVTGEGLSENTDAQLFTYFVQGNGFLHHMVRNLVGTFMEVGRGRIAPTDVIDILNARDRRLAGPTAAANGLCLMKVLY
jgi:tRNA pseudouridine38-40 synthase